MIVEFFLSLAECYVCDGLGVMLAFRACIFWFLEDVSYHGLIVWVCSMGWVLEDELGVHLFVGYCDLPCVSFKVRD